MTPASFSVDKYLGWSYDRKTCNCAHLTAAVWKELTGRDVLALLTEIYENVADKEFVASVHMLKKIKHPQDPCIVLMRYPGVTHVGVFIRGRILDIGKRAGVQFRRPVFVTLGYKKVAYYK